MPEFDDISLRRSLPHLLEEPLTEKQSADGISKSRFCAFGKSSMQGWRKQMEDADVGILDFDDDPNAALFAVFDGHGGNEVAKYAAAHLSVILPRLEEYQQGCFREALRKSFLAIDDAILADYPKSIERYVESPKRWRTLPRHPHELGGPGCAAIACLIKKSQLHIANAGDCRIVLCRRGVAIQLSTDHRVDLEGERKRIENAGGQVINGRVNGRLNLTRSIGDYAFKQNKDTSAEAQIITADSDTLTHDLYDGDEFLIIGCDGIWERRSPQELVEFVKPRLDCCRRDGQRLSAVAEKLLDAVVSPDALRTDGLGCDNMTCVIVDLMHMHQSADVHYDAYDGIVDPLLRTHCAGTLYSSQSHNGVKFAGFLAVLVFGLIVGLVFGIAITIAGFFFFILAVASLTSYILTFHRLSSTLQRHELPITVLGWLLVVGVWRAVHHCSWHFESKIAQIAVFAISGLILGAIAYVIAGLRCTEDVRKHILQPCSPANISGRQLHAVQQQFEQSPALKAQQVVQRWYDVFRARWWHDTFEVASAHVDEEAHEQDAITIHNKTLKKIKVCLYASDDCLCWIPLGGVSGNFVGFIPAEDSRMFNLANLGDAFDRYKLKVFRPGLLDIELSCHPNVRRGDTFVFHDAEQMLKRSSVLAPQGPPEDRSSLCGLLRTERRPSSEHTTHCNGSVLPRPRCSSMGSPMSLVVPSKLPSSHEILLRNRSQQDIRALLFSTDDYVNWIPLVGHVIACGDCILPDKDRWFNLKNVDAREFTLKVYDAGAGAKELTYVTVRRGQIYTFSNSLLS